MKEKGELSSQLEAEKAQVRDMLLPQPGAKNELKSLLTHPHPHPHPTPLSARLLSTSLLISGRQWLAWNRSGAH